MTKYVNGSIWLYQPVMDLIRPTRTVLQVYHEWLGGLDFGRPSLWKCLTWPHCSGMTWMTLWRTTPIHFLPGRHLCHHVSYCEKAATITSIITIWWDCGRDQYFSFFQSIFFFSAIQCSRHLLPPPSPPPPPPPSTPPTKHSPPNPSTWLCDQTNRNQTPPLLQVVNIQNIQNNRADAPIPIENAGSCSKKVFIQPEQQLQKCTNEKESLLILTLFKLVISSKLNWTYFYCAFTRIHHKTLLPKTICFFFVWTVHIGFVRLLEARAIQCVFSGKSDDKVNQIHDIVGSSQ